MDMDFVVKNLFGPNIRATFSGLARVLNDVVSSRYQLMTVRLTDDLSNTYLCTTVRATSERQMSCNAIYM